MVRIPESPPLGSLAIRAALAAALFGLAYLTRDHGWPHWISFVLAFIGFWWLIAIAVELIGRLAPRRLTSWIENRREAQGTKAQARWARQHADLVQPGDHEVVIREVGPRPINVVKAVREVTHFGLLEAKLAVDAIGSPIVTGRSESSCARIVHMLGAAGATASTRRTGSSTSS